MADQYPNADEAELEEAKLGDATNDNDDKRRKREEIHRRINEVKSRRAMLEHIQNHAMKELDRLGTAYDWSRAGSEKSPAERTSESPRKSASEATAIFSLGHTQANDAIETIQKLLPYHGANIYVDQRTNSIIVEGDKATVAQIEAIINRIDAAATCKDRRTNPEPASKATILGPGYRLRISVAGAAPDAPIDGIYIVDADGYVNLGAQYGKVKVTGMTADKVQNAILAELRKTLRSPQATVTIETFNRRNPRDDRKSGSIDKSDRVTTSFSLKYAKAGELVNLLGKIFDEGASFQTDIRPKSLIASADPVTMSKIEALVESLDQPRASPDDSAETGEYPKELLDDDIKKDTRMIELDKKIADIEELYQYQRSVLKNAENPDSDPALLRTKQRLKTLNEAKQELKRELGEIFLLRANTVPANRNQLLKTRSKSSRW